MSDNNIIELPKPEPKREPHDYTIFTNGGEVFEATGFLEFNPVYVAILDPTQEFEAGGREALLIVPLIEVQAVRMCKQLVQDELPF